MTAEEILHNPAFRDDPLLYFIANALDHCQKVFLQLAGCDEDTIRVDALLEVDRGWLTVRTPCGRSLIAARHVAAVFTTERQETAP